MPDEIAGQHLATMPLTVLKISALFLPLALCQGSHLLIHTDARCRLTVDGKTQHTLTPDRALRLKLSPGEHRLEAVPTLGGAKWVKTIALTTADTHQELTISLGATLGYWIDPATKLMWTAVDNGAGLSWSQAIRYCRELTLAGFKDWTLPSIDDLQQVSESAANENGYRIRGPIKLSGWQWSATPGQQAGEGWALDFGDGGRASVPAGDSGLNRALCVRRSQK
jgi:hypothetical protein